jgi:hypothetical protein
MSKSNPKRVWGTGLNLCGLWSTRPLRLTLSKEFENNAWWDENGVFEITKLGFDTSQHNIITFASINKKEVEAFISGVMAQGHILLGNIIPLSQR